MSLNTDKAFVTWRFKGVRFLAVENGSSTTVLDENGVSYGTWFTAESFRKRQRNGEPDLPIGKARVTISAVRDKEL